MPVFHEFCGPALCRPFFVFRVDPCLAGRPSWVLHVWPAARRGGAACPGECPPLVLHVWQSARRWCFMSGRVPALVLHVWQGVRRWCSMSGRVPALVLHVWQGVRPGAPCLAGESVCLYIYLHYRTCEFSLFSVSKNALSNFKNGQKEIIFKKTRIFFSKCFVVSNKVRTFASTKINNRLQ